jgi:hypothetical protein
VCSSFSSFLRSCFSPPLPQHLLQEEKREKRNIRASEEKQKSFYSFIAWTLTYKVLSLVLVLSIQNKKRKNHPFRYLLLCVFTPSTATNFGGTIEPKKIAKSTSKEHKKGNWYTGVLGLNLFFQKKS